MSTDRGREGGKERGEGEREEEERDGDEERGNMFRRRQRHLFIESQNLQGQWFSNSIPCMLQDSSGLLRHKWE